MRLLYIHIKDIELNAKFYQRFLNLGELVLATSITQGDSSINMRGIFNPRLYKDVIQDRTKLAIEGHPSNSVMSSETKITATDLV